MPDDMLGRIDAALEGWEHGPDAARWHADGGPGELTEPPKWVAYCAPGHRAEAAEIAGLCAQNVTDVRESPVLEGSSIVLARATPLSLPPMSPVTFRPPNQPGWLSSWLWAAGVNRPVTVVPIGV
jgi:hypothetical protein